MLFSSSFHVNLVEIDLLTKVYKHLDEIIRSRIVTLSMEKSLLTYTAIFFISLISFSVMAQERVRIQGKVIVPEEDSPEGMTVINETGKSGTITNMQGEFSILAAENDSISFSAVQFERFTVVVDAGVIDSRQMNVFLTESVTELPEVVVRPIDLTGHVNVDVNRIKVNDPALPRYTAAQLDSMGIRVEPDSLTHPGRNDALAQSQQWLVNGLNLVNIFKLLAYSEEDKSLSQDQINEQVRLMYNDDFFRENLDIAEENIQDFIYYTNERGLSEAMLQEGNELELIEFLILQSENYKNQQARN
jgi:hypothetical protein